MCSVTNDIISYEMKYTLNAKLESECLSHQAQIISRKKFIV